ncbi:MAG: flagellar basal body rod protein FlgB [Planctomycetes bacterium]|nr:flagellar basal body rod protein FlgB [Planctomycetota bacterium]
MFNSTTVPVLEQSAAFAQHRHAVLASNLANLDTPGYRVRDLNTDQFRSRLREAIKTRDTQPAQFNEQMANARHVNPFDDVRKNLRGIVFHDDSNVGLEQQVAEINKNQLQHNLVMTVLSSQFQLLGAAISERA